MIVCCLSCSVDGRGASRASGSWPGRGSCGGVVGVASLLVGSDDASSGEKSRLRTRRVPLEDSIIETEDEVSRVSPKDRRSTSKDPSGLLVRVYRPWVRVELASGERPACTTSGQRMSTA